MCRLGFASALLCLALTTGSPAQPFTNVAPELGIDVSSPWGDVFALDFNSDSRNDILFTSRYDGAGHYFEFQDGVYVELPIGLPDGSTDGYKVIPMDFDHDGDMDLLIGCYHYRVALMINENGFLVDRAQQWGLSSSSGNRDMACADLDHDGWMDIILGYGSAGWKVYRNTGDSLFADITAQTGLPPISSFHRFCESDVDLDGDVDLFMTRTDGTDYFFVNFAGEFEDRTIASGLSQAMGRGGCLWADFDNDKYPDLLTGGNQKHTIWHNNGNLTFTEMTVHGTDVIFDVHAYAANYAVADFDMDGDLDIYAGQPDGGWWGQKPNQFFRCDSIVGLNIYFTDIAPELNLDFYADTKPHFYDYDQDGDLDLFLRMYGEPSRLYRNNIGSQDRLLVSVVGPEGERDCWMTRVEVYEHGTETLVAAAESNYGGARRDGLDHYFTLNGNASYDLRLYFANGDVMLPDIYEGLSGVIPADVQHKLVVRRGVGVEEAISVSPSAPVPQDFAVSVFPNPFNALANLRLNVPESSEITVQLFDVQGRLVNTLARSRFSAGSHNLQWNAANASTGVYFLRVTSPSFTSSSKLVLVK